MLVLTRKEGEALKVGDEIIVHVFGIRGGQVTIGIEAPREIKVLRSEIADREPEAA